MSSASETPAIAPDEGASTTRPTATNPHVRLAIFVLLALVVPVFALIAIGVLGLFGFVMSCFLPGGKAKKAPAAEADAGATAASA